MNVEPAALIDVAVPEPKVAAPKKDTWINTLFRWTSYVFVFWMGILGVYIVYSVYATYMFNNKRKNEDDSLNIADLKKTGLDTVVFAEDDVSSFKPELGKVVELTSDRTTYDLLQGKYGPVVVLMYATWCVHCKNMMQAFEDAAAVSHVPFVKIEGQYVRQTFKHFNISNGFPTIYGVSRDNHVFPFVTFRTKEEFLKFVDKLDPKLKNETVHEKIEVLDEDAPAVAPTPAIPETPDSSDAPLASDSVSNEST